MILKLKENKTLSNILGLGVLTALVIASTLAITVLGPSKGILVVGMIISASVGVLSLVNYEFGFYVSIATGFIIFVIDRLTSESYPTGTIADLTVIVAFAGLLIYKVIHRRSFLENTKHNITFAYLIYSCFLLIQLFNPNMQSVAGWAFVIRKFFQFMMIFFIAINLFDSLKKIRFFFTFWTVCAIVAGLYGCYQEWFGFFNYELNWIYSVPARVGLYFINGSWRKFSILSDPAAYGITMAVSALLTIVFAIKSESRSQKIKLIIASIILILGMAYSGTRTSYFVLVGGMVFYFLLTITQKSTLLIACSFIMLLLFILFAPIYGNSTINRIRSAFKFSNDASYEVRDINRARIQPYIHDHPIGGGLATSGIQGLQYNPNHTLAGFPPDSGYLKTAIETGWIGLLLQCTMYFIIIRVGVHGYYKSKNKTLKKYYLATVICIFGFVLSQYSQVSIGQTPECFLFYSLLGVLVRLKTLSKN